MKRLFFSLLIFFAFIFIFPHNASADSKVTTSAHMTYTVGVDGNTHVVAQIGLTNTTNNFYVSSYTLKVGFPTVSNIGASDPGGTITPIIKKTDSGEEVQVQFNSVVAGLGKTLQFSLSFDTPDIAAKNGFLWEVNIPGIANQNDFQDLSVTLAIPGSFGKPTFIKPNVPSDNLTFSKDVLGKSGISLTFGKNQVYAYSLQYHIENNNVFPVTTDIALPSTTNYQDVSLDSLSPKPLSVNLDADGNWLAKYHLDPQQKISVTANGLVSLSLYPKVVILSDRERKLFLMPESYWETSDPRIISLARDLKTPEAIYNYVVGHLTYDTSRVKNEQVRLGASSVLQNPSSAVCLEFTDLFIALARSAGIPAREIDGFGYTQNTISRPLSLSKDVLHAWPEYYDETQKSWVMVDPTWGNTTGGVDYFHTLDFDHVAFVIKGASSTYPVPAGGYKFKGQEDGKDVTVSVTTEQITSEPTVAMQLHVKPTYISSLPIGGSVTLENTGKVLFPQQPLTIATGFLTPREQFVDVPPIPPYGQADSSFHFNKTPLLTNRKDTITILLGGSVVRSDISIVPISPTTAVIGGIILGVLAIIIFRVASSARRVSIPR